MDNRRRYDILKLYEKVFIVIFLLLFLGRIYLQGGIQLVSYVQYQINKSQYNIVEAQIIGIREYPLYLRQSVFGEVVQMTITYEMNEVDFVNTVYFYDDKEIGTNIDIAVDKNNPNQIRCCILDNVVYDKILKNFISLTIFFVANESIFLIFKLILKKIIQKNDNDSKKRIGKEKEISIRVEDEEIEKRQKVILNSYKDIHGYNLSVDDIAEIIKKYDISFNKDYIWCLVHLSQEEISYYDLLPITGNMSVVSETVRLRELGLPLKYYVIAKTGNNFLCGTAESSRVLSFSRALGITNTQYASIYDYIIEKTEERYVG
ncbi:MAG: SMI1/KNR4 family protein [Clostridium sp.]|nr:SMI1/KNR4 family protein [Clostridium sp.]